MSKILKGLNEAYGRYGRRDAYQRDYDNSVAGMGKRQSLAYQLDGGANDEGWDEPKRDYTPKPVAKKGMYFYNVPAGQDSKAQEVGLFKTKSGKWYSPFQNTRADMFFGKGRYWEPKTNESQLDELSNDTLASYKKKAGADASAADKKGDYERGNKRFKGIVKATKKEFDNDTKGVAEASPETTFNVLKGLKSYQVVIMNNYYRGKYSDYSGRYYYVLATSPEEAKQVVLDNADGILQDLLAMKSHNGKKILPRGSAVRITPDRIGKIEDGTVAGRMSTAGYKRMYSPQGVMMVKLSNGAIADVQGQEQGVAEDELDENCWKGYHKEGNKELFGKTVPNCVKNEGEEVTEEKCPHCGGPMFSEMIMNEKKDACYYKVKSRYKVWPSAYASGALVKCRKKGASNWGNSTKNESSILEGIEQVDENLRDWFKEKWVRFGPDGKIRGDCARGDDSEGKPKCLPQSKAHSLGKKGRASAAARKRREDPNPERSGKAINVNTKKKANEGVTEETIHVGYRDSSGDWIKTTTHTNYADAKAAMERLVKRGKKGVQHRYDNKGNIDPGAMMTARPDSGVAEEQLDEKWSQKYKDSINCSNPKGFSQRAHCQGKKK